MSIEFQGAKKMPATSKIKKYYVGFAVLSLLVIFLLVYVVAQGSNSKADSETDKALNTIATKLDDYIYKNNKLPTTLSETGATGVPSTIRYTKVDNSTYKVCVTYKNASNGYGADWTSVLWGAALGGDFTNEDYYSSTDKEKTYFDSYTLKYKHKKGENCQTVKPYISSFNSSGSSSSGGSSSFNYCDSSYNQYYSLKVQATVSKVEDGVVHFETSGQEITNTSSKPGGTTGVNSITSKKYDLLTHFCSNGQKVEASSIKKGQKITVYLYTQSDTYIAKAEL